MGRDKSYDRMFQIVEQILRGADPAGVYALSEQEHEYYQEVEALLPLLKNCNSPEDVAAAIDKVFSRMFEPGWVGPLTCLSLGRRIYEAVQGQNWNSANNSE